MKYGILQKNEKGYYLVENGKFMFIDRSCKEDLHEGFCQYEEIKDKGKYSFVCAKNVITGKIIDAIKDEKLAPTEAYNAVSYGGCEFWTKTERLGDYQAYIDGRVVELPATIEDFFFRSTRLTTHVSLDSHFLDHNKALDKFFDIEEAIELLIPKLTMSYKSISFSPEFGVYKIYGYGQERYYIDYNKQLVPLDDNFRRGIFVDITQAVTDFILEHRLAIQLSFSSDNLVRRTIRLNSDSSIDALFLATRDYSKENYEQVKGTLEANSKLLESYKKTIAKKMSTKSSLAILTKFNTKDFQLARSIL